MKIRIELVTADEDEEIIIKCKKVDENAQKIHDYLANRQNPKLQLVFFKEAQEYYFALDEVLFFETATDGVYAHTENDSYRIKYRLYELEEKLPKNFIRVSKSTILNVKHIYSIQRNITSSSRVEFRNTHKEVFVSRMYYKVLMTKLQERNNYEN